MTEEKIFLVGISLWIIAFYLAVALSFPIGMIIPPLLSYWGGSLLGFYIAINLLKKLKEMTE